MTQDSDGHPPGVVLIDREASPEMEVGPRRHRWLVWWSLASALVILAAFLVGLALPSPWQTVQANAAAEPVVTAAVEEREFSSPVAQAKGTLHLGATVSVTPSGGSDGLVVVTSTPVNTGATVDPGQCVVEISGRPVIFLSMPFPMYRDLHVGDRGKDVSALQQALSGIGLYDGPVDGDFGARTERSVRQMYRDAGYLPLEEQPTSGGGGAPDAASSTGTAPPVNASRDGSSSGLVSAAIQVWVPMREVLAVPYQSLWMINVAAVGTTLGEPAQAAAQLRGGAPTVLARVGVVDKDAFAVGQPVAIAEGTGSGDVMSGTVTAVGPFVVGSDNEVSGYDVTVSVDQVSTGAQDADTVEVSQAGAASSARTALSVPLTALRQDARGTYVSVAAGGNAELVRVPVTVGAQSDGWAEITDGDLTKGQRVVVAGG